MNHISHVNGRTLKDPDSGVEEGDVLDVVGEGGDEGNGLVVVRSGFIGTRRSTLFDDLSRDGVTGVGILHVGV